MRPRHRRHPLALLSTVVLAACGDGGGGIVLPSHEDAPSIKFTALPGDTVMTERGVVFAVRHTRLADADYETLVMGTLVEVVVDAGTPRETASRVSGLTLRTRADGEPNLFYADVATDGRHTIALRVRESSGREETASFTREFRVPELAYAATELPGLGGDTSAAVGINERNEVVGWARTTAGRRRAVLWRGGAPTVLPAADTLHAVATRINGAGDVLGAVTGPAGAQALVWRADGSVFPIIADFVGPFGTGPFRCCDRPDDLSEARVAMASRRGIGVALFDVVAADQRTYNYVGADVWAFPSLNAAGVGLGFLSELASGSTFVATVDGRRLWPSLPAGDAPRGCSPCGGGRPRTIAFGRVIDDDGNYVWSDAGTLVYAPVGGTPRYLDRFLGSGDAELAMSRHGGIVVKRDPRDSALYAWRSAGPTGRLAVPGWRIAELGTVNASGAIAARGIEVATGRHAALLLTPAAGAF